MLTEPTIEKLHALLARSPSKRAAPASALYRRMLRLLEELALAHADGTYSRLLGRLAKIDVLLLDDWGVAPLRDQERRDMLEIFDDRHGVRSAILTSQLPVEKWHDLRCRSDDRGCAARPRRPQRPPHQAEGTVPKKAGGLTAPSNTPTKLRRFAPTERSRWPICAITMRRSGRSRWAESAPRTVSGFRDGPGGVPLDLHAALFGHAVAGAQDSNYVVPPGVHLTARPARVDM